MGCWLCLPGIAVAAAAPPVDDVSLSAWAAQRVAGRPGLPAPETRSPVQVGMAGDPALATLALLGKNVPESSVASATATGLKTVAERPDDVVYSTSFTTTDGVHQEFATHSRPDDFRALYLSAYGYAPVAAATFEQARVALVDHVLGGTTEGLSIAARTNLVDATVLALRAGNKPIEGPWPWFWLFVVDDKPLAGWEHPVRYVFIAPDLSAFGVLYGRSFLELFDVSRPGKPRVLLTLVVPHPVSDAPPSANAAATAPPTTGPKPLALNYQGSAENCYAIILSGGANSFNNWPRYWEDSANIYTTLKRDYGLTDDHIIALISDGTDTNTDRNIGTKASPVYANSSPDLDGDGVTDTDGPCTHATVQAAFTNLASVLTTNDQLLVFITDHGYQESGWDAGIYLWGDEEYLRDDELADLTRALPCPVMVLMENCYSGGFVDDITNTPKRVIGAASAYDDTSEGWSHYDPFVYYFTAAVRGYYPGANGVWPWDNTTACDVDTTGDNRITFNEAWQHAYNNRAASDVPKLGQNPANFGDTLFMQHLHIELSNDTPLQFSEVSKDFSFPVRTYDWAAVGIAPTTDHDIGASTDRQFGSFYRSSTGAATTRDFVVYNGHTLAQSALHYARVYFGSASPYLIEAEWEAYDLGVGASLATTLGAWEVLDTYECLLTAGTTYDLTANVTSGSGNPSIHVFSPTVTNNSRASATWSQNAGGAGADETLRFRATTNGYYAFVVVNETNLAANYTLSINEAPALTPPAVVIAGDGSSTNKIRVLWGTVAEATHYKIYRNTVNNSATATALDDWTGGTIYDDLAVQPGCTYYYWVKAASGSNGDRESDFSVADTGYVDPVTLADGVCVTAATTPSYYDFRETNTSWWAVAVRYNVQGENWSLRLYDSPGFASALETSGWSMPVDFVVGDGHHLTSQYRGVEVYRAAGSGAATVEFEGGPEVLGIGTNAVTTWPAGAVVRMYDAYLTSGTYRITLDVTNGTANLDVALFGSQDGDYTKPRESYLARSTGAGNGTDESFTHTVTGADWYGLCLWGNDTNSASYRIIVTPLQAGLWNGSWSTAWQDTRNWTDGMVPDSSDRVTIPSGVARYPVISSTNAACASLTIERGASLTVSNRYLTIGGDLVVHGQLTLLNSSACQLNIGGDVTWESGSRCTMTGGSRATITGDWNFEQGAQVQLSDGYVYFEGTGSSWIRAYDPDCYFYYLVNNKSAGGSLGLSALSTEPTVTTYLFQYASSSLEGYSGEPLVIKGFFSNSGHIHMHNTPLVFSGVPTLPLKPNVDDYLHDLLMAGSGTLALDATYTNVLAVQGNLVIGSGVLDANGLRIEVGGDWSNAVGTAGFLADSNIVAFVGAGIDQHLWGTNTFHELVDARSGSAQLLVQGPTTVASNFTVRFQTAVWAPLTVQGTLDISSSNCQCLLWGSAVAQVARLNMGGGLLVWSGSLTASDLVNNGLYGYIDIRGGHVTLNQASSGGGEYFDLYGTLNMTGGELDLAGGSYDHYWPLSGTCSFTMNGGILDFQSHGWWIRSGFSGGITNGTLRCAGNVLSDAATFAPVGGLLEVYGPLPGQLRQTDGSTFPNLLVNKSSLASVVLATNLTVTGDVEIRAGVLNANSKTLSVAGSWSNGVGSAGFTEGTGTVRFYGTNAADLKTDETFYRLEVDKSYAGNDALETPAGSTVHVGADLVITDGALKLGDGSVLDIDGSVTLALGGGLNASSRTTPVIHVGRDWWNNNAGFDATQGFNPGYSSLVVFDGGGSITGNLATAAAQEAFSTLQIDRPAGMLRIQDPLLVRGDMSILNGILAPFGGPFTHHLRGHLTIEAGGAWYDTLSTVVFDGTGVQNLNHKSLTGWFKHLVVEKYTGFSTLPLTLQSDVLLLGGGTLTVREGDMALNGHYVRSTGNVTVEDGGRLALDAGSWIEVGSGCSFEVQGGGLLDIRGLPASPAKITRHAGTYALAFRSGSLLKAQDAVFAYMDANGLQLDAGAELVEPYTFNRCVFTNGTAGGAFLTLNTTQAFKAKHVSFPVNPGGGAVNVKKLSASGVADFVHADGAFAGESYDYDPLNLVTWRTGTLGTLAVNGPSVVTLGGQGGFTAVAGGDTPETPVAFIWEATDLSGITHAQTVLTDSNACIWSLEGTKLIQVTASNELGTIVGQKSVSVETLSMGPAVRTRVGGTNVVQVTLIGTGGGANYRVEYRPLLSAGDWLPALPGGTNVPGSDHSTVWTDQGGPGRDINTVTSLFYRAVMP